MVRKAYRCGPIHKCDQKAFRRSYAREEVGNRDAPPLFLDARLHELEVSLTIAPRSRRTSSRSTARLLVAAALCTSNHLLFLFEYIIKVCVQGGQLTAKVLFSPSRSGAYPTRVDWAAARVTAAYFVSHEFNANRLN